MTGVDRMRRELRFSTERFRVYVEHVPIGVFVADAAGNVLEVNSAFLRMMEQKEGQAMSGPLWTLLPPEAENEARDRIGRLKDEDSWIFSYRRDGARCWYRIDIVRIEGGKILGYTPDVTAQHRMVLELKDGTVVEVAFTGFPVMLSPGCPGIYAVYQDIGARKDAERRAADSNRRLQEEIAALERARLQTIRVLAATTEARDPYTAGHQRRVAHLSKAIALEMGMSPDGARHIELAALVHDLGKIETPSEILGKTKKLSRIELELVREHAAAGYRLLKGIELSWPLAEIVYQHHERIDGSGYPRGLSGGDILPAARIIGVADVVEAMASHRPYRPALGIDAALGEIESKKGIAYDPAVVDACESLFREGRVRLEE
jgi:PAS domain S-box-containing protein